jgi:decaprenylphospho-beta-D-ribofuranose 2-oxidase
MKGKQHTYQSYGNVYKSTAELFEPSTVEALSQILKHAQAAERRVSVAGGFNSFDGQNAGGDLVISMRKFDSMQYDATNHTIKVGAGARWGAIVAEAYRHRCVTYTCITGSHPTAGGTLSTHSHSMWAPGVGKEGNYCLSFDIMLANGTLLHCSRTENSDLFYGAIAGFGMLGFIIRIEYQLFYIGQHFEIEIATRDYKDIKQLETRLDVRKPQRIESLDQLQSQSTLFYKDKNGPKFTVYNRRYIPVQKFKKSSKFKFYQAVIANGLIRLFPSLVNRIMLKDVGKPSRKRWLLQGLNAIHSGTFWADPDYYWTKYCSPYLKIFGYKTKLYQMTHFIPMGEDKVSGFTQKVYDLLAEYKLKFCMFDIMYVPQDEPFVLSASRYTDGFYVNTTFMDYVDRTTLFSFYKELNELCLHMHGKIYLAKNLFASSQLLEAMHEPEIKLFAQLKQKYDPNYLLRSTFFEQHFPSYFGALTKQQT